mmetsp:Transcript_15726/g.34768  ORF Transcript_15726/g.34768 Transcript_15726/m.34768 type:complete len:650 (+) Transcript_15726:120-2069(+)
MSTAKNWADEYSSDEGSVDPEEAPVQQAPSNKNRRETREASDLAPRGPGPYIANISIHVDVTRLEIGEYLVSKGCSLANVELPLEKDGKTPAGMAIVRFKDWESLIMCLKLSGEKIRGTAIRASVFEDRAADKRDTRQGNRPDDRAARDEGRPMPGRRTANAAPLEPRKQASSARVEPPSRPKLNLQPRSLPLETIGKTVSAKPDIFGGGKAHDEASYAVTQKEKKIAVVEKKAAPEPAPSAPAATAAAAVTTAPDAGAAASAAPDAAASTAPDAAASVAPDAAASAATSVATVAATITADAAPDAGTPATATAADAAAGTAADATAADATADTAAVAQDSSNAVPQTVFNIPAQEPRQSSLVITPPTDVVETVPAGAAGGERGQGRDRGGRGGQGSVGGRDGRERGRGGRDSSREQGRGGRDGSRDRDRSGRGPPSSAGAPSGFDKFDKSRDRGQGRVVRAADSAGEGTAVNQPFAEGEGVGSSSRDKPARREPKGALNSTRTVGDASSEQAGEAAGAFKGGKGAAGVSGGKDARDRDSRPGFGRTGSGPGATEAGRGKERPGRGSGRGGSTGRGGGEGGGTRSLFGVAAKEINLLDRKDKGAEEAKIAKFNEAQKKLMDKNQSTTSTKAPAKTKNAFAALNGSDSDD